MAYNNTYGIEVINGTEYQNQMEQWSKPGGCKEKNAKCHEMAKKSDPMDVGDREKVNAICIEASNCTENIFIAPYMETDVRFLSYPFSDDISSPIIISLGLRGLPIRHPS